MDAMFNSERIYELIQQSEVSISHPRCFSGYIDINKFAELIVEECCDILDPGEHELIGRFQARKILQKHFGVEE
jgi:hypothetical protein